MKKSVLITPLFLTIVGTLSLGFINTYSSANGFTQKLNQQFVKTVEAFKTNADENAKIKLGEGFRDQTREITVIGWNEVPQKASGDKAKKAADSKDELILVEVVVINRSENERTVLEILGMHLRDEANKEYQPLFGGGIQSGDVADGEFEMSNLCDSLKDNEEWFGKIGFRVDKTAKNVDAVFEFDGDTLTVDLGRDPKNVQLAKIEWEGEGEPPLEKPAKSGKDGFTPKTSANAQNNEPEFEFE
ncbi:MAG: DUF4352 domain-containing protein, partial [Pyrinomonadaceae bacterium]|nr:DUF4352 domain-containing protein [Pyrinomonadaceae bacterium]